MTLAHAPTMGYVIRSCGLFGVAGCKLKGGLNFVEQMLKLSREREELRVVDDEFVTPTPTVDIAQQLVELSKSSHYGLYHATAEGSCSWYEFTAAIFELTGTKVRLERALPGEFPAKVPRPKYSVLENAALKCRSLNVFTDWKTGLQDYLAHREAPARVGGQVVGSLAVIGPTRMDYEHTITAVSYIAQLFDKVLNENE